MEWYSRVHVDTCYVRCGGINPRELKELHTYSAPPWKKSDKMTAQLHEQRRVRISLTYRNTASGTMQWFDDIGEFLGSRSMRPNAKIKMVEIKMVAVKKCATTPIVARLCTVLSWFAMPALEVMIHPTKHTNRSAYAVSRGAFPCQIFGRCSHDPLR